MNEDIENAKKNRKHKRLGIDVLNLEEREICFRDKDKASLGFKIDITKSVFEFLCEKFEITGPSRDRLEIKLREAVTGDGNEINKINALASSSLCALLCFFNISKDNALEYDGITYNDVYFEVRNKVVRSPSNMDVVLVGEDKEHRSAILFIECKYSEFLDSGKYELGKTYREDPCASLFKAAEYDQATVFQYGLKQLITHYLGIRNFIDTDHDKYKKAMSKHYPDNDDRLKLYRSFGHVGFLEIIYDFFGEPEYTTYLGEAKKVFNALADAEKTKDKPIKLLGTATYQEFFSRGRNSILPAKVRDYYQLNQKDELQ